MSTSLNRRIVLAQRPKGAPILADFRLEELPAARLEEGEVRLETLFLSLDPYMRGRMSAGPSYAPPVVLGEVMEGGAVSRVMESRYPSLQVGDLVLVVPTVDAHSITPHAEAFQAVVWHCLVSHPAVMLQANKWEGLDQPKI